MIKPSKICGGAVHCKPCDHDEERIHSCFDNDHVN